MTAAPQPLTDTGEMPAVHSFFRRETRLAGGLVRGVREGDTARAAVVDDHLDLLGRALHAHHTGEDELLWPLLLQRVPDELAPVVHLMESQHHGIEEALRQVDALRPRWRACRGGRRRGTRSPRRSTGLSHHLVEHMDAEEERLLPGRGRSGEPGRSGAALGDHARAHSRGASRCWCWG